MNDYVIETNKLTKIYKKQRAVDQVDMHVRRGAIYGLIGKNGAGKTTIMKMLTGMANPTEGEMRLFGSDGKEVSTSQMRVGALIERPGVYGDKSAFQNMKLKALAMGVYRKENIQEILELVGLSDTGDKKVKSFSMGMLQRLGIALALIGTPDMLILDEPVNGLDPQGMIEVRNLIRRLNREYHMTILISSHILEELSKVVTDYGIIDCGELIQEISAEELEKSCEKKIEIITPETAKATVALEGMGITEYTVADEKTVYVYQGMEMLPAINRGLAQRDVPVIEIKMQNDSLEEFFLKTVEDRRAKVC